MGAKDVAQRQVTQIADLAQWWDGFSDPLLSSFVRQALNQNLEIEQAAARVTQSRAALALAWAALLPSGDINAQGARGRQSVETPLGRVLNATPDFDRTGGLYEANLGATWEIDVFGGLRRGHEASRAQYEATVAGVMAARLSVAAQTADTYVAIRGLQARLDIARQQAETQRRLLSTLRLQYDRGVAAALQVDQAQGAMSQVEATIPVLESALNSAMNALDVLLATQPGTSREALRVAGGIPAAPGIEGASGPAELIRRRPDLIIAERRLAASNAMIGAAIAEYYPKFSLSGLLGTATTASGNLFDGRTVQAQGILGLRWRIFDFARVDAEIAAARGSNAEALATYRLSVLRASEDVENAFSALVKRESQARILAQGEGALARARQSSWAAYQGGAISLIEVLDADRRLLDTRDARAQAQTEAARAAIASFRALGGGWSPPGAPEADLPAPSHAGIATN